MKKNVLVFLLIFSGIGLNKAQFYTGLNAKMAIPVKDEKNIIDYGGGGEINLGYSFAQKAAVQMSLSNCWFSSIAEGYQMRSVTANARYYLLQNFVKPYLGIGGGYFHTRLKAPLNTTLTENAPGIIPALGILFNTHIHERLFIETEVSYNKIFFDEEIDLMHINIGIQYLF